MLGNEAERATLINENENWNMIALYFGGNFCTSRLEFRVVVPPWMSKPAPLEAVGGTRFDLCGTLFMEGGPILSPSTGASPIASSTLVCKTTYSDYF